MGLVSSLYRHLPLLIALALAPVLGTASEKDTGETESVCLVCHAQLGGPLSEPVTLWRNSIHSQMGNSCEGCHGGDPTDEANAMSPEKGFVGAPEPKQVAEFCGKCHVGVKENYVKSPHYRHALETGEPNCVTCHRSHDVQRASFELIDESLCSRCHSYENGLKIKQAFVSAELAINTTEQDLHTLGKRGMFVRPMEEKLFTLRNSLHQMTHTLDLVEIEKETRQVLDQLKIMQGDTTVFWERLHGRWWGGLWIGVFLLVLIAVLIQLLKTYED